MEATNERAWNGVDQNTVSPHNMSDLYKIHVTCEYSLKANALNTLSSLMEKIKRNRT